MLQTIFKMLFSVVAVLSALSAQNLIFAQSATTSAGTLSEFLETGWKASPENYLQSKLLVEDLLGKTTKPAPVHYAMSLVMLQQRKPAEAIEAVNEALAADPRDLNAHQFLIWLKLRSRDAKGAAGQMGKLAALLKETPVDSLPTEQRQRAESAVVFLGRAVGYLDGPLANAVPTESLQKFTASLEKGIGPAAFEKFKTEREQIVKQFQTIKEQGEALRTTAMKKHEEDAVAERAANKEKLEAAEAKLKEIADKVKTGTAEFHKLADPLEAQLTQLNSSYQQQNGELEAFNLNLARAKDEQKIAKDKKDSAQERSLEIEINSLTNKIQTRRDSLSKIKSIANPKLSQLKGYQDQFKHDINMLQNDTAQTQKDQIVLQRRQKELDKPYRGDTAEVVSLQAKLNALDTFLAFPLQEEKARLSKLPVAAAAAK